MTASCPECRTDIPAEPDLRQNEIVECPECSAELEVMTLDPLVFALAPEVEEDWGE